LITCRLAYGEWTFISQNLHCNIYIQYDKLKSEDAKQLYSEWYEIFDLSQSIDKYINSGCKGGEKYSLFVNQICYHFSFAVTPSELKINMSDLLVSAYDPLFSNLAHEKETLNKEKALALLKEMNRTLMSISKNVVKMNDAEKEKLLSKSSSQYIKLDAQVKKVSYKYQTLVDDYFRTYQK
jgi:hypothetical protein